MVTLPEGITKEKDREIISVSIEHGNRIKGHFLQRSMPAWLL